LRWKHSPRPSHRVQWWPFFNTVRLSALVELQIQPLNGIFLPGHRHFAVQYKFSRTSQPLYSRLHTNQPPVGPICQPLLFSPSFPGLSLLPILCSSAQPPERRCPCSPSLPPGGGMSSWRSRAPGAAAAELPLARMPLLGSSPSRGGARRRGQVRPPPSRQIRLSLLVMPQVFSQSS
jgi:hypothetical protein